MPHHRAKSRPWSRGLLSAALTAGLLTVAGLAPAPLEAAVVRSHRTRIIRSCVAAWSPVNYDAALGQFRNLGRAHRSQWGERYLAFDGTSGTEAVVSETVPVTRNVTVIFRTKRPAANRNVVNLGNYGEYYHIGVLSDGKVVFRGHHTSTSDTNRTSLESTQAIVAASGFTWVKVKVTDDNGAQAQADFYSSTDGVNWTFVESVYRDPYVQITSAGTALKIAQTSQSFVRLDVPLSHLIIYNDLTETNKVFELTHDDMTSQSSFTAATGQTVTLNGNCKVETPGNLHEPATPPTRVTGSGFVYLPNNTGNSITIPNPNGTAASSCTVTYTDDTTASVSPSGATLTFDATATEFQNKQVKRIQSADAKIDLNPGAHLSDGLFTQTSIPNDGSAGGTATINRATSGLKTFAATGETGAAWVFDGTDDYLYVPDHDLLEAQAGFTFGQLTRLSANPSDHASSGKRGIYWWSADAGYNLHISTTGDVMSGVADGTSVSAAYGTNLQLNELFNHSLIIDDSGNVYVGYNEVVSSPVTGVAGSIANSNQFRIGGIDGSTPGLITGEIHGAYVARRALTADELKRLDWELRNYGR